MDPEDIPDERDTIPAPPPSHIEVVGFVRPPRPLDDSGIFAFALDCESLDED